jgi:hypothetical protein
VRRTLLTPESVEERGQMHSQSYRHTFHSPSESSAIETEVSVPTQTTKAAPSTVLSTFRGSLLHHAHRGADNVLTTLMAGFNVCLGGLSALIIALLVAMPPSHPTLLNGVAWGFIGLLSLSLIGATVTYWHPLTRRAGIPTRLQGGSAVLLSLLAVLVFAEPWLDPSASGGAASFVGSVMLCLAAVSAGFTAWLSSRGRRP